MWECIGFFSKIHVSFYLQVEGIWKNQKIVDTEIALDRPLFFIYHLLIYFIHISSSCSWRILGGSFIRPNYRIYNRKLLKMLSCGKGKIGYRFPKIRNKDLFQGYLLRYFVCLKCKISLYLARKYSYPHFFF